MSTPLLPAGPAEARVGWQAQGSGATDQVGTSQHATLQSGAIPLLCIQAGRHWVGSPLPGLPARPHGARATAVHHTGARSPSALTMPTLP